MVVRDEEARGYVADVGVMGYSIYAGRFFFLKHKTAYEMRISDWSSDVCSSDLRFAHGRAADPEFASYLGFANTVSRGQCARKQQSGRASCRDRVCQYV